MNKKIYTILKANTDLNAILDERIYPEIAPEGVEMPFIIVKLNQSTPEMMKKTASKIEVYDIDLIVFSNNYDQLIEIKDYIKDSLDQYKDSEIDFAVYNGYESGYDNQANVYVVETNYQIRRKI